MTNYKIIGNDYFSKIDDKLLNQIVNNFNYNEELVFNYNEWSEYLRNYLILTHLSGDSVNIEDLYISRYYWFKKFYYHYSIINGKDMGMEQQISKILEEISNKIENFDWNELIYIDHMIEKNSNE
jgi:hypothetical protein